MSGRTAPGATRRMSPDYITDVEFPSSYVRLQAPAQMSCAAALGGFRPPSPAGPYRYCELGSSFGATLNPLAAANPDSEFVGVDFNAGHIRKASAAARSASLDNVTFIEASFDELGERDLPVFDFISTHGTFSWLTPAIESALLRFVAERLAPGGLFYVDYMSLPGKAAIAPVWTLMRALTADHAGDSLARARDGLRLLGGLRDGGLKYFHANPPALEVVGTFTDGADEGDERLRSVAHHALAEGWRPRYFTDVADRLDALGLRYAGSAMLPLNDLDLVVPSSLRPFFDDLDDPRLVELLKDYALNQQQRQDVFIKDAEPDGPGADEHLRSGLLVMPRADPAGVRRQLATIPGRPCRGEVYDALVAAVAGGPTSLASLGAASALGGFDDETLLFAFRRLVAADVFHLCVRPPSATAGPEAAGALERGINLPMTLNRSLLRDAAGRGGALTLVSPVTGGGSITLNPIEAVLLDALVDAGPGRAVQRAKRRLRTRKTPVHVQGASVRPDQLDADALGRMLQQLGRDHLGTMLTLGIAEIGTAKRKG